MNNLAKFFGYTMVAFGAIALFTLMMLYGAWAAAFVGVHLWAWFVVPTFGVHLLTMPQAFGVSLLVAFWTYHYKAGCKDERGTSEKVAEFIGVLMAPWVTLSIGYICHHFFM